MFASLLDVWFKRRQPHLFCCDMLFDQKAWFYTGVQLERQKYFNSFLENCEYYIKKEREKERNVQSRQARSNKHMRPWERMKSHGNQSLVMGDGMPWNGGPDCVVLTRPAHHVHTCMKTSNWLGRKGCLGCREATRASGTAGS